MGRFVDGAVKSHWSTATGPLAVTYTRRTSTPPSPPAYVIASEQHVAVPDHEKIVFEQFSDEAASAGRGRINDARVAAPHGVAPDSATDPPLG
jgi:hypothetical protein